MQIKKNSPILLIEDDRVDAMTVKRAARELALQNQIIVAKNGEEGLALLKDKDQLKPLFILLDLNMPRMNGLEFLQVVKSDPLLKRIPVIVLTTSAEYKDKFQSFDLNVVGYMTKPIDYNQFVKVLDTIYRYWSLSQTLDP